jgi:uncharacterized protein (DUF2344 family)
MKHLLILFLLTSVCYSQEKLKEILPIENDMVVYSDVVKVDSVGANGLYNRAKKWIALRYKSANNVIQLDNKEDKILIGKGNFSINYYTRNPVIGHTIQIEAREGRYKYTISNFIYSDVRGDSFAIEKFPNSWAGKKKLYRTIDEKVNTLINDLKKVIATVEKDDW